MKKSNTSKGLHLYDVSRDGVGVSKKSTMKESGFKRFFVTYKENFGKLVSVNMFFVLGNFPLIFLVIVLSGYTKIPALLPTSDLFQNISALFITSTPSPENMTLYALEGMQTQILVHTPLSYVFYGIAATTLLTFGCVNVGTAYILRNMAKGDPVFIWSDFWYAVKRNWKQALPFGIIDGIINALLVFNVYSTVLGGSFITNMMFWGTIVLIALYFSMRCYIYVQMVTFDLSVFKILKNSLIFALLGAKRNVMALLGNIAIILLELAFIFGLGALLIPLAVAAPLAIMFATLAYIKIFASYFKIKEILIDPYMAEHPELFPAPVEEEIIMRDDVTEKERLEEIKRRNGIE